MKNQSSKDKLLHATLAEDARLLDNEHDQELLTAIDEKIDQLPLIRPALWKRPAFASSLAACLVLALVATVLMPEYQKKSPRQESLISNQAPLSEEQALQFKVSEITRNPQLEKKHRLRPFSDSAPKPSHTLSEVSPTLARIKLPEVILTQEEPQELSHITDKNRSDSAADLARYSSIVDNTFLSPSSAPLSTFSVDTDRASYTKLRHSINNDLTIHKDSIRVEELINAFAYDYTPPTGDHPFALHVETANTPWNEDTRLVKIGLKGREISAEARPATNLVLLCDVSGSMHDAHKIGYLRKSFMELVENLDERDTISIITYAGSEGIVLHPTKADKVGRPRIFDALESLSANGSTNGEAGIKLAYKVANQSFIKGGINRILLATDGDFNVGVTGDHELLEVVKKGARKGTYLTVLGFGRNLNDSMLEKITNDGNGQYFFIDSMKEGRRVFSKELTGTLLAIAKDVKIQVEFNPAKVAEYRLLGYANRKLNAEDFNNDRVDAGDIGAGHTVTAFYEIVPGQALADVDELIYASPKPKERKSQPPSNAKHTTELLTIKLRYKHPEGTKSVLIKESVTDSGNSFEASSSDFKFASAVALYGMLLRETEHLGSSQLSSAERIITDNLADDPHRREFLDLVKKTIEREKKPLYR